MISTLRMTESAPLFDGIARSSRFSPSNSPASFNTKTNWGMASTRATGTHGEQIAMSFLRKQGLEILEMNYQYGHGEIDIIAREGEILVFCEVKTRYSDEFGPPECAITDRKQAQVRKTAEAY